MRGLGCCYPAHNLGAVRMIWHVYEKILPQTVSNCWMKAAALSCKHVAEISMLHKRSFLKNH